MQAWALLVVGSVGQKTGKGKSGGDESQTKVKSSDLGKVSTESGRNQKKKTRGLKVSAISAFCFYLWGRNLELSSCGPAPAPGSCLRFAFQCTSPFFWCIQDSWAWAGWGAGHSRAAFSLLGLIEREGTCAFKSSFKPPVTTVWVLFCARKVLLI